jgi:hypothetical protein
LNSPILAPLIALVLWSFVMWAWLYATRILAIASNNIVYDPRRPAHEFHDQLPARVRWKADNYDNLMEQPTLFYAVTLTLAMLGAGGGLNTGLAWLYVLLRIAHSLVQAVINVVMLRFALFMVGSLVLLVMSVRAALIGWYMITTRVPSARSPAPGSSSVGPEQPIHVNLTVSA